MTKRIKAFVLVSTIVVNCFYSQVYATNTTSTSPFSKDLYIPEQEISIKYTSYLENFMQVNSGSNEVVIKGSNYSSIKDMPHVEKKQNSVITQESGEITWEFDVPNEGMYNIQVKYFPTEGKNSTIERTILVNDELPYKEASAVLFHRAWVDKDQNYKQQKGNQTFPSQVEKPEWLEIFVMDADGFFNEPLKFHFSKGKNKLTFRSEKEPMEIETITLTPILNLPNYEQYLSEYQNKGINIIHKISTETKVQGENAITKSSPSFFPLNDRTSVKNEPYHSSNIVLNTIGGKSWKIAGDWINWEVNAPENGLYRIAFRFKQNELRGLFSSRSLKINGEVPFQEARELRFYHKTNFQLEPLKSVDGQDLYFYLEKGLNTISLQNTLGVFAELIYEVEDSTKILNDLYRDIVVITGTAPDRYRDYQLTKRLPHLIPTAQQELERLNTLLKNIQTLAGTNSDKTAVISKTIVQLEDMIKNPDDIARKIASLKDNITALGKWTLDIKEQPLTIDYFMLLGSEDKLPKAEGNFFQNTAHELKSFIGSFTNDFNSFGEGNANRKTIEVWVTTGRDQLEVIRRLINETFETQNNTSVKLKLVSSDVLLPATFTGKGPDIAIQIGSTLPINFAFRDAAYDVSTFSDFDEIYNWFAPGALETFEFLGGYYALPDQMSFPVMFYRKDIFSELQIPIPETWDDVVSIVPYLQKNNMEFYLDTATPLTLGSAASVGNSKAINSVFLSMFYQSGGDLYSENGSRSELDSAVGMETFAKWTDFYTKHSFPKEVDFVTRFRIGEVPIAVVDFTNYSKLSVSAPEIRGIWDIAPIPGTKQEDGTIRRDLPCTTSASLIIKASVEKRKVENEAWEFLKWWTSADTQTKYAREMEAILGSAARYPVANLTSFEKSAWPKSAMEILQSSLPYVREIRQVPGGYITGRNVDNAFLKVIDKKANPSETLYDYNVLINDELHKKRQEFGLEN